jgi:hypothetical protein
MSNNSGMVDIHRHMKGEPGVLARYTRPAYVAVKLRNKVLPGGAGTMADIYVVNNPGVSGEGRLLVEVHDGTRVIQEKEFTVTLQGHPEFGQLLAGGLPINPGKQAFEGYVTVHASLHTETQSLTGSDELFIVRAEKGIHYSCEFLDESGTLAPLALNGKVARSYAGGKPGSSCLVLGTRGAHKIEAVVLEWIREGNSLLIVDDADLWMADLLELGVLEHLERKDLGEHWFGGHFFVRDHPIFEGLPVNTAFNWEYQVLARYSAERYGLILDNSEAVVGAISMEDPDIATAVGIIPYGRGKIIFSTLDLLPNLASEEEATIITHRILQNLITYASSE